MQYQTILDNGIFYYPAWKHYGTVINVVCDRCRIEHLSACVGYLQQDLCMQCVHNLTCVNLCEVPIYHPLPPICNPPPIYHPLPPPICDPLPPHIIDCCDDYFDEC